MSAQVSPKQIADARLVKLSEYLPAQYPLSFSLNGDTGKLQYHPESPIPLGSCRIPLEGIPLEGNPIDFLMRHLGYTFVDAVRELSRFARQTAAASRKRGATTLKQTIAEPEEVDTAPCESPFPVTRSRFSLPERAFPPYSRLFGFMRYQGISYNTTKALVSRKLLYQDSWHGNAVFLSRWEDYYEVMGTISFSQSPFFLSEKKHDGAYWSVTNTAEAPTHICVCSTALDAICLMELQALSGIQLPTAYASVGTKTPENAVKRIIANAAKISAHVFLAVSDAELERFSPSTVANMDRLAAPMVSWSENLRTGIRFCDPAYTS